MLTAKTLLPAAANATPGTPVTAPSTGPVVRQSFQRFPPVAGFNSLMVPKHTTPLILPFSPPTNKCCPSQALGDMFDRPHSGHPPPYEALRDHSGPDEILERSNAYQIPFLLATPTIWCSTPLIVAWNKVGVDPKSLSVVCTLEGTCQLLSRFSDLSVCTTAGASVSALLQEPTLPVAK